jgi:hypothetical protein
MQVERRRCRRRRARRRPCTPRRALDPVHLDPAARGPARKVSAMEMMTGRLSRSTRITGMPLRDFVGDRESSVTINFVVEPPSLRETLAPWPEGDPARSPIVASSSQ